MLSIILRLLYKFKVLLLKKSTASRIPYIFVRLFHLMKVDGKDLSLEKLCLIFDWQILLIFLDLCFWKLEVLLDRYLRYCAIWEVFKRMTKFMYHHHCWRNSKPNFGSSFSLEEPVIASAALYHIPSIFWWKVLS